MDDDVSLVPVEHDPFNGTDPWEAAAARVRAKYPTRPASPEATAASMGAIGWGDVAKSQLQGLSDLVTTPGRAYREGLTPEEEVAWGTNLALTGAGAGMPMAGKGNVGIFGGKLAKTADQAALAKAEQMHAAGAPREAIWNETGWFQGADGKWRFEIPDQAAAFKPEPTTPHERNIRGDVQVRDVFEHPELYSAYPAVAQNKFSVEPPWPSAGSYDIGTGEIAVAKHPLDSSLSRPSVALHELQHATQAAEGFASGANPSIYQRQHDAQIARDALAFRREMDALNMPHATPSELEHAVVEQYKQLGAADWLPSFEARDLAHDRNFSSKSLQDIVDLYGLNERVTPLTAKQLYERTAGEVEARNVQARMNMTPEERRAAPPWTTEDVPREQQIVRYGSQGPQMSIETPRQGIRAYHGSPYDFDRFDMSKIGTGEGAQAYGHGLYFAENPKVAEAYKGGIDPSNAVGNLTKRYIDQFNGDIPKAIEYAQGRANAERAAENKQLWTDVAARMKAVEGGADYGKRGRMYEVNINARPEQFLDWDRPLSAQPTQAKELFDANKNKTEVAVLRDYLRQKGVEPTGADIYRILEQTYEPQGMSFGVPVPRQQGKPQASSLMNEAGIPGIRYLNQGSRAAGAGSRNYVLFRDDIIDIVRKYGIAGLSLLPPAVAAQVAREMGVSEVDHDPFAPQRATGGRVAGKSPKAKVHYHPGSKAKRCADCTMFRAPNDCTAVLGTISPWGVCDLFERKTGRAAGGRVKERTLYVCRPLLNGDDLRKWAASQGIATALPADDMHVTIAYSRDKLAWDDPLRAPVTVVGGKRSIEKLGDALVLRFDSPVISRRWAQFRKQGASWDWPSYKPHVTITYGGADDIENIEPYRGVLRFGPEKFDELNEDAKDDIGETPTQAKSPGTPEIVRAYDVPYLAGSSNDNKRVYIDRRVPKRIAVKLAGNGRKKWIDPGEFLAAHEIAEHQAMRAGKPYEQAHVEDGTAAERALVKKHGLDWGHYEKVMDGLLSHIEHERPGKPPPDLYLKPYPHREEKILARLEKKERKAAGGRVEGGFLEEVVAPDDIVGIPRALDVAARYGTDPWEASAARVRAKYPTRPASPEAMAASQGAIGWGDIAKSQAQGLADLVTTPGRAYREGLTPEEEVAWGTNLALMGAGAGMPRAGAGELGSAGGKGIRAYHGSPYDFDRFDMSKIGTGEGTQAYGHGLYFAESEPVARSYKDAMRVTDMDWPVTLPSGETARLPAWVARGIQTSPTRLQEIRADFVNRVKEAEAENHWNVSGLRDIVSTIDAVRGGAKLSKPGHMYEVNINARPEQFLDWDKKVRDMGAPLQERLQSIGHPEFHEGKVGSEIYHSMARSVTDDPTNPLWRFGNHNPDVAAQVMREAGIPGIRYLDQGSRAAGEGSRNYVLFRDDIIDIVRKYGIAGLSLLPPAVASEVAREMGVSEVDHDPFAPQRAAGGRVGAPEIDRRYDVPYLAGSSNDNKRVYIDRRVPKRIAVKLAGTGKKKWIDPGEFLAAHEIAEHQAMRGGKPYEKAHVEDGTAAERALVKKHGLDWGHYEKIMDGFLAHIEHERPSKPPPDLYLKPYPHREEKILARLERKERKAA